MRGINSLGSEKISHLIQWLQLSLGAEGPWPLPFFPVFMWLGAGQSSQLGCHHLPCEPACTGIWIKVLIEVVMLNLLQVLGLNPSWVLLLEYLDLLQQMHPEFSYLLSQSLLERIEFLT